MRAILMAAGIGSRLTKTPNKPKCTWEVNGVPLIRQTVEMLTQNGISVHMVVGYRQGMIRDALRGYRVTYHYNPFYRVTNSIGSLWFAREALDGTEDVILGNADVFWEQPLLELLKSSDENACMLGDVTRAELGDYFFHTNEKGYLLTYGKQMPLEERTCEYVGLSKLKAGFVSGFRSRMEAMIEQEQYDLWWENVLYHNCEQYPVYVQDVEGRFWGEIDYLQDYNRIVNYVESKR